MKVVTDRRCLDHEVPFGFPERPERLSAVLAGLADAGHEIVDAGSHPARVAAVEAVHGADYPDRFRRSVARGDGLFGSADTPVGAGTWEAANAAVDAVLAATDHVLVGGQGPVFAAVRPPGHHAERELAMGFCYFANIAVAARYALRDAAVDRVAIVDVDVHHGNGTQHLFDTEAEVFFASLHQYPFYPGTGGERERGRGAGEGMTLNVPLSAGSGDDDVTTAIRDRILPALRGFGPDLLLVSAGFDAWDQDPLGGFSVSLDGFQEIGALLGAFGAEFCEGRALAVLEGGYDLERLGDLAASFCRGFGRAAR